MLKWWINKLSLGLFYVIWVENVEKLVGMEKGQGGVEREREKFGQKFQMIGDKQCKQTVIRQDILEYSCKC